MGKILCGSLLCFFGGNKVRTLFLALSTTMFVVDRISVKVCDTYERSYTNYVLSSTNYRCLWTGSQHMSKYSCQHMSKYSDTEYFIQPTYIGIQQYEKNVLSRNWYFLHTYVRTQYKPKILHTQDLRTRKKVCMQESIYKKTYRAGIGTSYIHT